ncbi:MerR family transcriptional regulator [Megasphaera cerevisiae]|uniref:MerR family transcriptional regulator n=1 Tax=Megasphaera cerevisiae TaxID=39029 RepID=UPI000944241B|nr:MerR family transcriptional regulator [Megasphaera cerevisiae]MCI1751071.1 MerR family transcriptional regulator [Megasphaera cerevisiae]OKY53953.1 MerR family transcriptional regulator [Megasphaera cerevisiae]
MDYSIGEFSKRTGLGIHTLRYYEQENLILPARNNNNRRRYREADLAWIDFIKRLKATGMPIKKIKQYAALRAAGNATLSQRMVLLIAHRQMLAHQLKQLQEHKAKLDQKIIWYQQELNRISQK